MILKTAFHIFLDKGYYLLLNLCHVYSNEITFSPFPCFYCLWFGFYKGRNHKDAVHFSLTTVPLTWLVMAYSC